jgi:hypothetical protein
MSQVKDSINEDDRVRELADRIIPEAGSQSKYATDELAKDLLTLL